MLTTNQEEHARKTTEDARLIKYMKQENNLALQKNDSAIKTGGVAAVRW